MTSTAFPDASCTVPSKLKSLSSRTTHVRQSRRFPVTDVHPSSTLVTVITRPSLNFQVSPIEHTGGIADWAAVLDTDPSKAMRARTIVIGAASRYSCFVCRYTDTLLPSAKIHHASPNNTFSSTSHLVPAHDEAELAATSRESEDIAAHRPDDVAARKLRGVPARYRQVPCH